MNLRAAASLVQVDDLPEYPISAQVRLDSHYFIQWNLKRWRASTFRRRADPEVGWYGFQLFCMAQDETPIGTLPCDDHELAHELHLPLERWQSLLKREITPMHNWHKVQCDNGEIRWAHPVVTEVAVAAVAGSTKNAEDRAKARERKRLKDLGAMLERIGASQLLRNPGFVERVDDWLIQNAGGRNRTEPVVREAIDAVSSGRI